ncbi:MAG: GNAT family N-acetyltransferase [Clostridia bacterium]|nr:GNAT family N-acetyltransferase [Clostridia bacterium]
MKIENNILKYYLRNCYFITGTAYAGKSTMCKLLSEKYNMLHMEENYNTNLFLSVAREDAQKEFTYFNRMSSFQDFVSRSPDEYEKWVTGTSKEVSEFEIAHLISVSQNRKVMVDTNIPLETLKLISSYNHVAVMLSDASLSVERFFDRPDMEKSMLHREIMASPDPEWTLNNFKSCIARVNNQENYDRLKNSGFFTLSRKDDGRDTRDEVLNALSKHFLLDADCEVVRAEKGGEIYKKLEAYAFSCSWPAGKHLAEMMREERFSDWETAFAAVKDNEIIGFCTFLKTDYYPENRYLPWISSIFVDENHRGKRIMGKLIEAAENHAYHLGFEKAYIPSDMNGVYEKFGYKQIDTLVNYAGDTDNIFEKEFFYAH